MPASKQQRGLWVWTLSLIAVGFGLLTIKEGGTILFGDEEARSAAGNYVPFVLWFNFVAGFAYVIAGAGLWMQQRWGAHIRCLQRTRVFGRCLRASHGGRHESAHAGMGGDRGYCLAPPAVAPSVMS